MGAAIPLNIATQLQTYLSASVPLDNVEIIATKLLQVPPSFAERARPIQINGQLLNLTLDGKAALRTAAGPVSLKLSAPTEEQRLSLKNILTTPSKSRQLLTLIIQPDSPKQATLLVPKNEPLNILRTPQPTAQAAVPKKEDSFAQGGKLTLTVLPDKIEKSILAQQIQQKISQPLLSKTTEQAVEKAFGNLHKTVETTLHKNVSAEAVVKESSPKALTPESPSHSPLNQQAPKLQHGQELHAKIDRVITHLKQEVMAQNADKLAPNQIKATVVGKSHSNHVILNAGERTLFVKQDGHLPTGTKMILTLTPHEAGKEIATRIPTDQEWPTLRDLVNTLQQTNPQVATRFLQTKLPSPAQSMTGATLFFMSAMQAGKINEWLGLPVHMSLIKENKKELVDQIVSELTEASKSASDVRAGEWKSCPIPIHYGQDFDMLRLYVRDQSNNNSQSKESAEKKHSHFVLSVNLSRLGPLQLEGFSRPKKLDLIVRSERKLPKDLSKTIRAGYIKSMEALGMSGNIAFQTGHDDWIRIENSKNKKTEVA